MLAHWATMAQESKLSINEIKIKMFSGLAGHQIILRNPGSQGQPLVHPKLPVEGFLPPTVSRKSSEIQKAK